MFGVLAAIAAGFALYFASRLAALKDADLARFQMESTERIAVANSEAAEANERAAEASQKAEEERLARVKIEKQLAPRTLSDSDREAISRELRSFTSHFSRRKIKVSSYSQDAEGIVFALMINDILMQAGIETEPIIGRAIPVGLVNIGVMITGPGEDKDFIVTLANSIRSRLETRLHGEWDDKYVELAIHVGVKPVAGLPDVLKP